MKILSLFCLFFVLFINVSLAHPGKLDSNNGHTCYTNCAQYGLKNGQYHYHSGNEGYSGPLGTTKSINVEKKNSWSFGAFIVILILLLMVIGSIMTVVEKFSKKDK